MRLRGRLNMTSETRLYLDIGMQNSASGIYAEGALSVTGSPVFIVATGSSGTGRKLYIKRRACRVVSNKHHEYANRGRGAPVPRYRRVFVLLAALLLV